VILLEH